MNDREFAGLVKKYHQKVDAWIKTKAPMFRRDSEDVEQEVWFKVYLMLPSFRNDSSFATWLFYIVRSVKIDYLRKQQGRYYPRTETPTSDAILETMVVHASAQNWPEDALFCKELTSILDIAVNRLSVAQMSTLSLAIDGLAMKEIAKRTGCPLGTANTRLHHARRKLKKTIEDAIS